MLMTFKETCVFSLSLALATLLSLFSSLFLSLIQTSRVGIKVLQSWFYLIV